jgi:hypothetical protein
MENLVARAIEAVGGPTQASYICRVSAGTIFKWRTNKFIWDGPAAKALAAAAREAGLDVTTDQLVTRPITSPNGGKPKESPATGYESAPSATESLDRLDEQIQPPLPSATACAA